MDEIWKTRRRRTARAVTAFFAAFLLAAAASADPPLTVLQQAGYLGRWAMSCDSPPSPQNMHVIHYEAGGLVRRRLERGPGVPALEGTIDGAQLIGPGELNLVLRNDDPAWGTTNGMLFDTLVEFPAADRWRTMRSVSSDGRIFINDGKYLNGQPVPTLRRCSEPPRS